MLVYGQKVPFQKSKHITFKSFHTSVLPSKEFGKLAERYINGFVNADEVGQLFIGVEGDGEVSGTFFAKNPRKQMEEIRGMIDEICAKSYPPISPSNYIVQFHPIYKMHQGSMTEMQDKFVLGISVKPDQQIHETSTIYAKPPVAYIWKDGTVIRMSPSMISERWQQQRMNRVQSQVMAQLSLKRPPILPLAQPSKKKPRVEVDYNPETVYANNPQFVPSTFKLVPNLPRFYEPTEEEHYANFTERVQLNGWWYDFYL